VEEHVAQDLGLAAVPLRGRGGDDDRLGVDHLAHSNSSGGVMGKMIDAQSIVVASTATQWYGGEAKIPRPGRRISAPARAR
jgi:hypothetical protein